MCPDKSNCECVRIRSGMNVACATIKNIFSIPSKFNLVISDTDCYYFLFIVSVQLFLYLEMQSMAHATFFDMTLGYVN